MPQELIVRLTESLRRVPGAPAARDGDPASAAVAAILSPTGDDLELLLIRRAEREGDPWSGQIALPGGRRSALDDSLEATARRETHEEIGWDLSAGGALVGQLDELRPRTAVLPSIVVTPFVYFSNTRPALRPNEEVAEVIWAPLRMLGAPELQGEREVNVRGATWRVPSYLVSGHVVWGLTERIVRQLLERAR